VIALLARLRDGFLALVGRVVDASGRHPAVVLLAATVVVASSWTYAYTHFALNSDLLELLPRESPGFKAFEHQLGRVGGGASLIVVVESPDRKANEKFIDTLAERLAASEATRTACVARCAADDACKSACGPQLIAYVESGTKDVRRFYEEHKWLYADLADLEDADRKLETEIGIRSGMVDDFEDGPPAGVDGGAAGDAGGGGEKKGLGLDEFEQRWEAKSKAHDDFPTGYFATPDGTQMGLRIVSTSRGLGDEGGDALLAQVRATVDAMDAKHTISPALEVGYAGDIPNAIEEKDSLVSDAAWATGGAFVLIFLGIVFFFRSVWAPLVIALPAAIGVGVAYSFAMWRYGFVNTSGAFLGAIILGNGINYPIVLLHRYREFRARGMEPAKARREAVLNAFRAELVGSLVASIAYGSLVVTQFRGFNQFGVIGFVGMLLVWVSMIPCVPALLVIDEWVQSHVPAWMRERRLDDPAHQARGPVMGAVARLTERFPRAVVLLALGGTLLLAHKLPSYLRDPWEYDWSKLGSRSTKQTGAGAWSNKADKVFGGKMNIAGALMLADTPEQVPKIKAAILRNDAADPEGKLVADVATIADLMPGTPSEQDAKLAVLARIREKLTPRLVDSLSPEEQEKVKKLRPPENLSAIAPADLPDLLRRRFQENDGRLGTVFYVKFRNDISFSDGHILLRIAKTTDNVEIEGGQTVQTASRSTVFAEIIRSMERDGPLATAVSFACVLVVVVLATASLRGSIAVVSALLLGITATLGFAALSDDRLNFFNFIALPITFGIGSEYPFNVFDRSRLLNGDTPSAVRLSGGAVALCSYTTTIGYSSMLVSDQQALQSFGQLAMVGEIACLVAALLYLPALLNWWRWKPRSKS
jgi:predicted RND superfamily exporter protein